MVLTKTTYYVTRFTSHRFLLTDTRVPRNTKELVGRVGKQKVEEPAKVGKVLSDIQGVVEKAGSLLSGSGSKETLAVRHPLYHLHFRPSSLMPKCLRSSSMKTTDSLINSVSHILP